MDSGLPIWGQEFIDMADMVLDNLMNYIYIYYIMHDDLNDSDT